MIDEYTGKEKREFLRFNHEEKILYRTIKPQDGADLSADFMNALSKNLSASGILFIANVGKEPEVSNLVVLDLDYSKTNVCREIEDRALILNDKLIGRVVRIEDNEDGTCGVGVAFIKKTDSLSREIKKLENLTNRS